MKHFNNNYNDSFDDLLAKALGITVDEVDKVVAEVDDNTGHSGSELYGYIISFKDDAPMSILKKISRRDSNNQVWIECSELG